MPRKPKSKKAKRPARKHVNPQLEVNRQKASLHMPIVPKYQTTLEASFMGNFALASAATNFFDVPLSNVVFPYETTAVGGITFPGTVVGALALTALNPNGLTALGALYSSVRTMSIKHEIIISPTEAKDAMLVCCVPYANGVSDPVPGDIQSAVEMPYSKSKVCIAYQNKTNMLSFSMKPWTLLGLTKTQYYNDLVNYPIVLPGQNEQVGFLRIFYQTFDNGVTAGITTVQIKTTYHVEFFNPIHDTGNA